MLRNICLAHLSVSVSVCRSVCLLPESVLWQNGLMYPDTIWDGEWGRSRDGCIRWGGDVEGEGAVFGVNLGHPIVTNGDSVA